MGVIRRIIRLVAAGVFISVLILALVTIAHKNFLIDLPTERVQR